MFNLLKKRKKKSPVVDRIEPYTLKVEPFNLLDYFDDFEKKVLTGTLFKS